MYIALCFNKSLISFPYAVQAFYQDTIYMCDMYKVSPNIVYLNTYYVFLIHICPKYQHRSPPTLKIRLKTYVLC